MTFDFNNDFIKIDQSHADLIYGLVVSSKPVNILELGLGGGMSTNAILDGINYNKQEVNFTVVDNWVDFGYICPDIIKNLYKDRVNIVTSDEKSFIFTTDSRFDFIMSDADHLHTNEWFEYVYDQLLNWGGILIYHDVNFSNDDFVNLREIYKISVKRGLSFKLFNKNSLPEERCHRGLMVIFK